MFSFSSSSRQSFVLCHLVITPSTTPGNFPKWAIQYVFKIKVRIPYAKQITHTRTPPPPPPLKVKWLSPKCLKMLATSPCQHVSFLVKCEDNVRLGQHEMILIANYTYPKIKVHIPLFVTIEEDLF